MGGRCRFSYRESVSEACSQQGCFAESGSRAARSPRAFGLQKKKPTGRRASVDKIVCAVGKVPRLKSD
jgi:hypothetical protein